MKDLSRVGSRGSGCVQWYAIVLPIQDWVETRLVRKYPDKRSHPGWNHAITLEKLKRPCNGLHPVGLGVGYDPLIGECAQKIGRRSNPQAAEGSPRIGRRRHGVLPAYCAACNFGG